jgi:hypothetical protein
MRCRVNVYDRASGNYGPGDLVTCIEDALDVGYSEYANAAGERYFTLPYNHWAHAELTPLVTHIEVQRQTSATGAWVTLGWGLLADSESSPDETTYYVDDYLSLFDTSISGSDSSYTSAVLTDIMSAEVTAALTVPATNNRLDFLSVGFIDPVTETATLMNPYTSRLTFLRSIAQTIQAGTTNRSIFFVERADPVFDFFENIGVDRPEVSLEYGGLVSDFRLRSGYGNYATMVKAIGQKREGASILYSTQSANAAVYGQIEKSALFLDVIDQDALDRLTLSDLKKSSAVNRDMALVIKSNALAPYDGYALGDSVPVTIKRGPVQMDHALYTIWGLEWIGHRNGSETLRLITLPQLT